MRWERDKKKQRINDNIYESKCDIKIESKIKQQNDDKIKPESNISFNFKNNIFQEYLKCLFYNKSMKQKIKPFCIGFDKHNKSIMITHQSKYALLCSNTIINVCYIFLYTY